MSSYFTKTCKLRNYNIRFLCRLSRTKLFERPYCGNRVLHDSLEIIKSKHGVRIDSRVALIETWNANLEDVPSQATPNHNMQEESLGLLAMASFSTEVFVLYQGSCS